MKNQTAFQTKKSLSVICFLLVFCAAFGQQDSLQNGISFNYDQTHFDRQFANDWRQASLELKHRTGFGTVLGRLSQANRFGKNGWQGEAEAYPVISRKVYAFAGLSYSGAVPVFARWRAGATLYYNVAKGWEAEGGFRYLFFDRSIWVGTAGVSRYMGAWLLNARSFFSVRAPFNNQSFFLKIQRYLKNERDYVWLQAGSGVSPDESRSIQLNTMTRLVSKRINAGAKLSISQRAQITLAAGYARDEYRIKTFGNQYNGSAGLGFRF